MRAQTLRLGRRLSIGLGLVLAVVACEEPRVIISVSVTPKTSTLASGTVEHLFATAAYSDGSTIDVTKDAQWTSASNTVATVVSTGESGGVVTAAGAGTTDITVTYEGKEDKASVTVTSATLTQVVVTPVTVTIGAATTRKLTATGTFSDESTQDVSAQVTWTTSDATLATVDGAGDGLTPGLVHGLKKGTVEITATSGTLSAVATVTVTEGDLVAVEISPDTLSLPKGVRGSLNANARFADGSTTDVTASATWTTSDPLVATVAGSAQGASVFAAGAGSATITASFRGKSGTATVAVTAATLSSLAIVPPTATLVAGGSVKLTATGTYSDQSVVDLTSSVVWFSSDATVAPVSLAEADRGTVSALAAGSATITATSGDKSATSAITVTPATLVSIELDPSNPSLPRGTTVDLTATGIYSDGRSRDITADVAWSSSAPGFATVASGAENPGRVEAIAAGGANIVAALDGKRATTRVTVTAATLESLTVAPPAPTLAVGTTVRLTATGTFSDRSVVDVTEQVTWTSSNGAAATVSTTTGTRGLVSAAATGATTVVATLNGVTASARVTVTEATVVALAVSPATPSVVVGNSVRLTATATLSDATTQDVTESADWTTSAPDKATVSTAAGQRGLVTGVADGTSVVTATFGGRTASATVRATSPVLQSIVVTPPASQIARGTTQQYTATGNYSDGVARDVTAQATWSTSNAATASVSNAAETRGLATGIAAGSATITASVGNISGSTSLAVTAAALVSIRVNPANATTAVGTTLQFVATGVYSDLTEQVITQTVTWSSSDPTVASISNTAGTRGLATTVVAGNVTITAALNGVSGGTTLHSSGAALVSIALTPAAPTLARGTTLLIDAVGTYSDGSTRTITESASWTSASPAIASVSSSDGSRGLVSGIATGNTRITATLDGKSGSVTVVVSAASLTGLAVLPGAPSIARGTTLALSAVGSYSDGTTQDLTQTVNWTSSDPAVATVTSTGSTRGRVTGVTAGAVRVRAAVGSFEASITVTVTAAALTAIAATPASNTVPRDTPVPLVATATYSDGTTADVTALASWTSSDESILTVSNTTGSNGIAVTHLAGTATATASLAGRSGNAAFTVTAATLDSISVTPAAASVAKGLTKTYTATGNYSNGGTRDLSAVATFTTSPSAIAAFDQDARNVLSALTVGATTVTATFNGKSGSTGLTVTPATAVSLALGPAGATVAAGRTVALVATATLTDGTTADVTQTASWSAANAGATVTNTGTRGVVTGATVGTTAITATYQSTTATLSVGVTAAVLDSISVSFASASVAAGLTSQATATGLNSDGTTIDLTSQATFAVTSGGATVDASGLVTTTAAGPVVVRATFGGKTGSGTLTVTAPVPASIAFSGAAPSVVAGRTTQLALEATLTDGSVDDVTADATYATSDATAATVVASGATAGLVTGRAAGPVTITATLGVLTAQVTVTVTAAALESLAVTLTPASVAAGRTSVATATGTFSDGNQAAVTSGITWAIASGPATVDASGEVTTSAAGAVVVRATVGSVTATGNLTVTAPVVVSIAFSQAALSVAKGRTVASVVNARRSDGTSFDVSADATYESSDASIATVVASGANAGRISGQDSGSATITATFGGFTATADLTVLAAAVDSISVSFSPSTVAAGRTSQANADATLSDGSHADVTSSAAWVVVSGPATVDAAGLVTTTAAGTVVVSATSGGVTGQASLTVGAAVVVSIAFSTPSVSVPKGRTAATTVTATKSDGTSQDVTSAATFASSDVSIVTVVDSGADAGRVTGIELGDATVTASFSGFTDDLDVTTGAPAVDAVTVTFASGTIAAGRTNQATANATLSDGTSSDVTSTATWAVTSGLGTVSSSGLVTTASAGPLTVRATSDGVSGSATFIVDPAVLDSLAFTPADVSVAAGDHSDLVLTGTFSDGTHQDVTADASYVSDTEGVATVSNAIGTFGRVTGVSVGTATIVATIEALEAFATVQVTPAEVRSIVVSGTSFSVAKGLSRDFTALAVFSDGSDADVTSSADWSVSPASLASVTAGRLTGLQTGSGNVKAMVDGVFDTKSITVTAPVLVSVAVEPATVSIAAGRSATVRAVGTFSDATTADVTSGASWTSPNEAVVTVASAGAATATVTGVAEGTAAVSVTVDTFSGHTDVTVTAPEVDTLTFAPATANLPRGTSVQLAVTSHLSDGSTDDVTSVVSFTTSDSGVATVSAGGEIQAVELGTATITATLGTVSATVPVTVGQPTAVSIAFVPTSVTLAAGRTRTIDVVATRTDGTTASVLTDVVLEAANPAAITLTTTGAAKGRIAAVAEGSSDVSATLGALTANLPVTVTAPEVESIALTPSSFALAPGGTRQVVATATFSDASTADISDTATWTTSDAAVATVDTHGLVTGVAEGAYTLTAMQDSVSVSTSLTVALPVPTLTVLEPCGVVVAAESTVDLTGTNFTAAHTVRVNGTPVATNFVDATHLSFDLTATTVTTWDLAGATVTLHDAGGTQRGNTLTLNLATNAVAYADAADIISTRCASCHNGGMAVDFSTYGSLVGPKQAAVPACFERPRVMACGPTRRESYLLDRIQAFGSASDCGSTGMPQGGPALDPLEIQTLIDWAALGAPQ